MVRLFAFLLISLFTYSCTESNQVTVPGANRIDEYRHLIENRKVAVVANQTSMIDQTHLVDSLINIGIDIKVIFAPEHGFRDLAPDGNTIQNGNDPLTGIKILSLYGTRIKPSPEHLENIDVLIFDIQDVGVRFYTYLSTLHYVMEACAENEVKCIVLDRPNPNGFYFDGNIADTAYRSFVAMHPVPVVTGMTIGEYARMINGEQWLDNGIQCDLTVIKCKDYTHNTLYELPVRPSPNLPNMTSIYLYPSICFFEGTNISLGRGTPYPFQIYGSPLLPDRGFNFIPERLPESTNPPLLGEKCYGIDLRDAIENKLVPSPGINLQWIIDAYNDYPEKENFFTAYIERLAAGPELREQIQKGMTAEEIRNSWKEGLEEFGKIRERYLLYE